MAFSVKKLRYETREIIQSIKRGGRPVITYRGTPIARLVPIKETEKKEFADVGFGMWRDRADLRKVSQWLDEKRAPRFKR